MTPGDKRSRRAGRTWLPGAVLAASLLASCQAVSGIPGVPGVPVLPGFARERLGLTGAIPPDLAAGGAGDARTLPDLLPIRGRAVFPARPAGRPVQATAAQVTQEVAVALIDIATGKTLAGGRTDATGAFTLAPNSSFIAVRDGFYYLQVSRRGALGSNQVSMVSVLRWTAGGWASLTSGTGGSGEIVVNPTTTAVTLMAAESGSGLGAVLGKVGVPPAYATAEPFGSFTSDQVAGRAAQVAQQLGADVDPVGDRPLVPGNLAPDDAGDPRAHHDYVVTRGGVASAFVWVPVFAAYQLVNPATCGHAGKPVGYWVKDRPGSGAEDADWAWETFGGFYAAKYEASRADATPGDPTNTGSGATAGTSTTLEVQRYCVPWGYVSWDTAARASLDYHPPYSHLLRDDEWTALAVWATIWDQPVHGNNIYRAVEGSNGLIEYVDDPTHSGSNGRALTGSGTTNGSISNLTSHTGTAAGVFDLNGNVWEWTASAGATSATSAGNYVLDDADIGERVVAEGFISSLATDARLRRYGLPGATVPRTAGGTPLLGSDFFNFASSAATGIKPQRGGNYAGHYERAGVWTLNLGAPRNDLDHGTGFRPAVRF